MPLPTVNLTRFAQMAELVDAPASGAGDRKVVEVRVLFWAPTTFFYSLLYKDFNGLGVLRGALGGTLRGHLRYDD